MPMWLEELGRDVYACMQEEKGLGTSNSGLVNRGGGLVVDTFWDLPHTRDMIAHYARVNNQQYRTLKAFTPGPYTFILAATRQTPKRLQNPRRRTIGIRVPDHPVPLALLSELSEPLMSSTLLLPGDDLPMTDAREIQERLYHSVDAVIDGGNCGLEPTSVIDLEGPAPVVARRGKGDVTAFE